MSYNVCNNPDLQNNTDRAWSKRKDRIFKMVENESPDVICFQEMFKDTAKHLPAFKETWERFKNDYEFVTCKTAPQPAWWERFFGKKQTEAPNSNKPSPYKPEPELSWWRKLLGQKECGWNNVIAYKKSRFRHVDSEPAFQISDNMISQVVQLQPRGPNGHDEACEPFYIFNIDHGLDHKEKIKSNEALVKKIDQIANRATGGHFFVCGNFNSTPEGEEPELAPFFSGEDKFKDLSKSPSLSNQDNVSLSGTFVGYPYDPFVQNFYPEQLRGIRYVAAKIRVAVNWTLNALASFAGLLRLEKIKIAIKGLTTDPHRFKGKFNGHLDRCFYRHKGVETNTYEFKAHLNTRKFLNEQEPSPSTEKEILAGTNGKTELDARGEFPSDHLPLIVKATKIAQP